MVLWIWKADARKSGSFVDTRSHAVSRTVLLDQIAFALRSKQLDIRTRYLVFGFVSLLEGIWVVVATAKRVADAGTILEHDGLLALLFPLLKRQVRYFRARGGLLLLFDERILVVHTSPDSRNFGGEIRGNHRRNFGGEIRDDRGKHRRECGWGLRGGIERTRWRRRGKGRGGFGRKFVFAKGGSGHRSEHYRTYRNDP